ncbi:hypothetical protein KKF11_02040, partial [Patescibacteria group bacterium]|nr:hypothetical protein [Patescibacteria group bacterium]
MKELLILVSKKGKKKQQLVDFLNKDMEGKVKTTLGKFSDLTIKLDGKKPEVKIDGKDITDFSLVYYRRATDFLSLAGTLSICLDLLGVDFVDTTFRDIGPAGSKLTSLTKLSLAGLPIMPSFFCDREKIEDHADFIISEYGFPIVAKELARHRGRGIYLLKTKKDFEFWRETNVEDQFIFQSFYPNEKEYRLLVLEDRVAVYERKIRTDVKEFRSNVSLGAKEEFIDVEKAPAEMKEIVIKAAKVLNLQIAGADVLIDSTTGKQWILEV